MCPACMATAALIAAGATSTFGLAAYAAKKLLPKVAPEPPSEKHPLPFLEPGGEAR